MSFRQKWSKLKGVGTGLLGPTVVCLLRCNFFSNTPPQFNYTFLIYFILLSPLPLLYLSSTSLSYLLSNSSLRSFSFLSSSVNYFMMSSSFLPLSHSCVNSLLYFSTESPFLFFSCYLCFFISLLYFFCFLLLCWLDALNIITLLILLYIWSVPEFLQCCYQFWAVLFLQTEVLYDEFCLGFYYDNWVLIFLSYFL